MPSPSSRSPGSPAPSAQNWSARPARSFVLNNVLWHKWIIGVAHFLMRYDGIRDQAILAVFGVRNRYVRLFSGIKEYFFPRCPYCAEKKMAIAVLKNLLHIDAKITLNFFSFFYACQMEILLKSCFVFLRNNPMPCPRNHYSPSKPEAGLYGAAIFCWDVMVFAKGPCLLSGDR